MPTVNVATAKAHLSELISKAEQGEIIEIERHGKPVARLGPSEQPRDPIDFNWLDTVIHQLPTTEPDGARRLREEERY